jgi:hypothetical protein
VFWTSAGGQDRSEGASSADHPAGNGFLAARLDEYAALLELAGAGYYTRPLVEILARSDRAGSSDYELKSGLGCLGS